MDCADDRAGQGNGEARLLEAGFAAQVAAVLRFDDLDTLGRDIDAALRRQYIAADLGVAFVGLDDNVAGDAYGRRPPAEEFCG